MNSEERRRASSLILVLISLNFSLDSAANANSTRRSQTAPFSRPLAEGNSTPVSGILGQQRCESSAFLVLAFVT